MLSAPPRFRTDFSVSLNPNDLPGEVDGRHFTEYVDEVKALKRNDDPRLEQLLLRLVDATEADARANEWGVAPWYYEELAILYRKRGDREAEIEILERFAAQAHAPGVTPPRLLERLTKLKDGQT